LQQAVASIGVEVASSSIRLEWEPFLLNPNVPEEGEPILDHLTKKYGTSAVRRFADPHSPMMEMGRAVGIEFTNNRNVYPTIRAHCLVEYLKETNQNDKANEFMEKIFHRYFVEGANINSLDVLKDIAARECNIPASKALEVMNDENRKQQIMYKDRQYKHRGVSGVPFFMIHMVEGRPPVSFSGAQPAEVIAEGLQQVLAEEAEDE
jgi:predicted DsbA family dithiol-disulfide isomerase